MNKLKRVSYEMGKKTHNQKHIEKLECLQATKYVLQQTIEALNNPKNCKAVDTPYCQYPNIFRLTIPLERIKEYEFFQNLKDHYAIQNKLKGLFEVRIDKCLERNGFARYTDKEHKQFFNYENAKELRWDSFFKFCVIYLSFRDVYESPRKIKDM